VVAIGQALAGPAVGATLTVLNTADNGGGSLRATFNAAATGDVIVFAPALAGQTINLTSGPLTNTGPRVVTIDGDINGDDAPDITLVPGAGFVGILNENGGSLTLDALVIANGSRRGVYNYNGDLTIRNSTISGNGEGGVFNYAYDGTATCTIQNSTISQNQGAAYGGGVENYAKYFGTATCSILNSTLSGNSASLTGGGLDNYALDGSSATATIEGSTFSGNTAAEGAAIYTSNFFSSSSSVSLTNSTVSGNTGGASIIANGYDLAMQPLGPEAASARDPQSTILSLLNTTVSNNSLSSGASLFDYNAVTNMANTVIANTSGGSDCSGALELTSANLIEDGSCATTLSGDPALGPLANNGGPTRTHLPAAGSPLIDAGNDAAAVGLVTDQRGAGFPRFNGIVDIGSVEVAAAPVPAADLGLSKSVALTVDADSSGGFSPGDTVTFTLTLTNFGPDQANGIQVNDPMPGGFNLTGNSPSQGTYVSPTWNVGSLVAFASATLDLTATINPSGPYTNLAQIAASSPADPNSANDAASVSVPVRQPDVHQVPVLGWFAQWLMAGLLGLGAAWRLRRRTG